MTSSGDVYCRFTTKRIPFVSARFLTVNLHLGIGNKPFLTSIEEKGQPRAKNRSTACTDSRVVMPPITLRMTAKACCHKIHVITIYDN